MFRLTVILIGAVYFLQDTAQSIETAHSSHWTDSLYPVAPQWGLKTCYDMNIVTVHNEAQFKDTLLESHKEVRDEYNSRVQGASCADMTITPDLTWDNGLAKLAQLWANMCSNGKGYQFFGCSDSVDLDQGSYSQNSLWFWGQYDTALGLMTDPVGPMAFWLNPKDDTNPCTLECDQGKDCTSYLNVVNGAVSKMGCAYTDPCHACDKDSV